MDGWWKIQGRDAYTLDDPVAWRPLPPGVDSDADSPAELTPTFDKDTLADLRRALSCRGLAAGLPEAFLLGLFRELDAGNTSWHVIKKRNLD